MFKVSKSRLVLIYRHVAHKKPAFHWGNVFFKGPLKTCGFTIGFEIFKILILMSKFERLLQAERNILGMSTLRNYIYFEKI